VRRGFRPGPQLYEAGVLASRQRVLLVWVKCWEAKNDSDANLTKPIVMKQDRFRLKLFNVRVFLTDIVCDLWNKVIRKLHVSIALRMATRLMVVGERSLL
jgi:hypothetical protein